MFDKLHYPETIKDPYNQDPYNPSDAEIALANAMMGYWVRLAETRSAIF